MLDRNLDNQLVGVIERDAEGRRTVLKDETINEGECQVLSVGEQWCRPLGQVVKRQQIVSTS